MEQQFNLVLTDRWKSTGGVVGSIVLLGLVVAAVLRVVGPYSEVAAGVGAAGLLFSWVFWFVPRVVARFCAVAAVAVLDEQGLTVRYPAMEATRRLDFADMATYSMALGEDLTIRPHQGPVLNLHLNSKLSPQGLLPLLQFEQGFRRAVAGYQQRHPAQPPIRELGFLLRPGGTVVLVLWGALVGWLGWRALRPLATEGAWGGFLLLGLLFGGYALLWGQARRR